MKERAISMEIHFQIPGEYLILRGPIIGISRNRPEAGKYGFKTLMKAPEDDFAVLLKNSFSRMPRISSGSDF